MFQYLSNMLMCNVKSCTKNNYPLIIKVDESKIIDTEFNPEFIEKLIPKLDWPALYQTILTFGVDSFPKEFKQEFVQDEEFLHELHNYLLQTHIIEGYLECPNCKRKYPIKNGIPNMILKDEEIS